MSETLQFLCSQTTKAILGFILCKLNRFNSHVTLDKNRYIYLMVIFVFMSLFTNQMFFDLLNEKI